MYTNCKYTGYVHTYVANSVVPINRITIGNSRLLGNFVTIGNGKFLRCKIGLFKSNNLMNLHLKLHQRFVINMLILIECYNFVSFIVC